MKILHITEHLANMSGVAQLVLGLAQEQHRQGHAVGVLFGSHDARTALVPAHGVTVHSFQYGLRRVFPGLNPAAVPRILNLIPEYDIIHIHGLWNFFTEIGMCGALARKRPYIVSPHGALDPWALRLKGLKKRLVGTFVERHLLNKASLVHALTPAESEDCRRYAKHSRVVIVPNAVADFKPVELTESGLAHFGISAGKRVVLFLGRVHPKKGLDILISAWGRVQEHCTEAVLVIAGGDSGSGYLKQMESRVAAGGLGGSVRFVGEVAGDRKVALLSLAALFVLPSYSEGLPMAALEALSAGIPCLVSDHCNLPQIPREGAGIEIPPTVEALIPALTSLLKQHDLSQMRERARALALSEFSWQSVSSAFLRSYHSITKGALPIEKDRKTSLEVQTQTKRAGLVRLSGEDRAEVDFHNQLALVWEEKYRKRSFRRRADCLVQLLNGTRLTGTRWLDAGCGSGHLMRSLVKLGCDVDGVDAAPSMIAVARSLSERAGMTSGLGFATIETIEKLPGPEGVYDGVVCSSVLEYLAQPETCLSEFYRVLKPGGLLAISVPNRKSLLRRMICFAWGCTKFARHKNPLRYMAYSRSEYSLSKFHSLLEQHGFSIIKHKFVGTPMPGWVDSSPLVGTLIAVLATRR